jgi:DNA-nicking Smr family endonuclease
VKKPRPASRSTDEPDRRAGSDAEAFDLEMSAVTRLGSDPRGRVHYAPPVGLPAAAASSDTPVDDGEDAFAAPGVDRREIRKLKRGDYAAGGRRDLHGMTAAEACASVRAFIESSRHSRHRCICIVHGRGLHSEGRTPVLRDRVRKYLRSHRLVLAFANAPPSDGGTGAVYVLLRK